MAYSLILVWVAATISVISVESRSIGSSPSVITSALDVSRGRRFVWNWNRNRIQNNFTCPAIYGRYPHPQSCEYFYECRFGYATLMHCNRGYLYDEAREQCRDQRRVNCRVTDGHKEIKDTIDEKKEDIIFKCPYIWGTFPHPTDCSRYFVCLYNLPTLFECYGSDLFHDKARKCLPRSRVNCGKRLDRDQMRTSKKPVTQVTATAKPEDLITRRPVQTTTTKISTTTEVGGGNFYCPFPYGRYADPEDCSRYYECRFSIPYLNQCPESTLYDERKEQCRKEEQVRCGGRPGGKGDDDLEEQKKENFQCPYIWGTFPHPDDCSKYIICIYNVPTLFTCRKNELFHIRFRRCLPKEKVNCDYRINPDDLYPPGKTTDSTTIRTTVAPTIRSTLIYTTLREIPITTTTVQPKTTAEPTTTSTTEPTTTSTQPTSTTSISTTRETTTTTTTWKPTTTTATRKPTTTTTTRKPTTMTTRKLCTTGLREKTSQQPSTLSYSLSPNTKIPTDIPVTKPNTPPPTDCAKDDLDCIVDETGDVTKWFACPKQFGHYAHGSSRQLFIHCDRWVPFVKKCADGTVFSPDNLVCMWDMKKIP